MTFTFHLWSASSQPLKTTGKKRKTEMLTWAQPIWVALRSVAYGKCFNAQGNTTSSILFSTHTPASPSSFSSLSLCSLSCHVCISKWRDMCFEEKGCDVNSCRSSDEDEIVKCNRTWSNHLDLLVLINWSVVLSIECLKCDVKNDHHNSPESKFWICKLLNNFCSLINTPNNQTYSV